MMHDRCKEPPPSSDSSFRVQLTEPSHTHPHRVLLFSDPVAVRVELYD